MPYHVVYSAWERAMTAEGSGKKKYHACRLCEMSHLVMTVKKEHTWQNLRVIHRFAIFLVLYVVVLNSL